VPGWPTPEEGTVDYEESSFAWADTRGSTRPPDLGRLLVDLDRGVLTVHLHRPDRLNAIDARLLTELTAVLRWADADEDVRVVVLTGSGRAFCAGAELSDDGFGSDPDDPPSGQAPPWVSPYQVRKPVVAAINGPAVGAGLTLALQCDLRVAADDAVLALPFVRLGVVAEWMGHWTLVRHLGVARTQELLLTGRRFTGAEAAGWGLVNVAVPTAEVLTRAVALAREIAEHAAPVSVAVTKRLVWEAAVQDRQEAGRAERLLLAQVMAAADAREGVAAFLGRRAPEWVGRVDRDLPEWPETRL
jgi:enoyl-CoA hydratase/carnithine racemase